MLVAVAVGCAGRRVEVTVDPALVAADRAWDDRAATGYDPVERALTAGLRQTDSDVGAPDAPWRWRRARLFVERGIAAEATPQEALERYGEARSEAMRCLEAVPGWSVRREEAGLDAALTLVGPDQEPCVAWAALAWSRWIAVFGANAAALDVDEARVLAVHAAAGPSAEVGSWASALLDAVAPRAGGDAAGRESGLRAEVEAHPQDVVRRWDLLWWVGVAQQRPDLVARHLPDLLAGDGGTPADRAIRDRARALQATLPK